MTRTRLCLAILTLLCAPGFPAIAQSKQPVKPLSDAIVFDLFMNYELTEKNGNLSTLMDYVPSAGTSAFRKVEMSSNYGGESESSTFTYGDRGRLDRLTYQRADRLYTYDVEYENDRPIAISIAGKKRIELRYGPNGLVSITRDRNGALFEYNLSYPQGQNRADIELMVVADGKRRPSPSKYHVTWDERHRLTGYSLGIYSGREITYSDAGELATFAYYTHDDEKRTATWQYVVDAKSNWTERRFNKLVVKRSIEYRKP